MKLPLFLVTAFLGFTLALKAQGACSCASSPITMECTTSELKNAKIDESADVFHSKLLLSQDPILSSPVVQAKITYQALSKQLGPSKLAQLLNTSTFAIRQNNFEDEKFQNLIRRTAKTLSPDSDEITLAMRHRITLPERKKPSFVRARNPSQEMSFPGQPSPIAIPNNEPVSLYPKKNNQVCWARQTDAFAVSPGNQRLQGAFGTNFNEVGRIARIEIEANGSHLTSDVCAFTLVSPRWALTALHCVGDQENAGGAYKIDDATKFKGDLNQAWRNERALFLGHSASDLYIQKMPPGCYQKEAKDPCPWQMLAVKRIIVPPGALLAADSKSRIPKIDLALIELVKPVEQEITYPKFSNSISQLHTVTLVSFGRAAEPYKRLYHLQVGWNKLAYADSTSGAVIWSPKNQAQSSICPGDSGGAVFQGYENGGCECNQGKAVKRQRLLAGVISSVKFRLGEDFNAATPVRKIEICREASEANAVMPNAHRNWICSIAPDIAACQ
jgi:hypothetical protein